MDDLKKIMDLRVAYMGELEKLRKEIAMVMKNVDETSKVYSLLSFEVKKEDLVYIYNPIADRLFYQFLIEESKNDSVVKNLVYLIEKRDDLNEKLQNLS